MHIPAIYPPAGPQLQSKLSIKLQPRILCLEQPLQRPAISTVMRDVQRFARPILASYVLTATVKVHGMVKGFASNPVELFCGVWLIRLSKYQYMVLEQVKCREAKTYILSFMGMLLHLIQELLCDLNVVGNSDLEEASHVSS